MLNEILFNTSKSITVKKIYAILFFNKYELITLKIYEEQF